MPQKQMTVKKCLCSEESHDHTWINAAVLVLPHLAGFRLTARISAYTDQPSTHQWYVQESENLCQCIFLSQSGMWLAALQLYLPLQHLATLSETNVLEAVELPRLLTGSVI